MGFPRKHSIDKGSGEIMLKYEEPAVEWIRIEEADIVTGSTEPDLFNDL